MLVRPNEGDLRRLIGTDSNGVGGGGPCAGALGVNCWGWRPESAKKERAVIQRLCRSRVVAVNFRARTLVKIRIDRFTADPSSGFFGSGVLSSTSSTDWIVTVSC